MVRRFKDTGAQAPDAGAEVPDIRPEPEDRAAVDPEKATSPSVISAAELASLQDDYRQLRREVQTLQSRLDAHLVSDIELGKRSAIIDLDAAHLIEPDAAVEAEPQLEEEEIPLECALVASASEGDPVRKEMPPCGRPRSASRQPVDFCVKSSRWRDCRGRFCRAPSPAR